MSDAGLSDPLVRPVVRFVKGDPLKLLVGTAVMGTAVALDGDGATTYVICAAALLPIYQRLGVKLQYMATVLLMSIGIMNIVPWGGPTARAAAAMHIDVSEVFIPLIPAMLVGFAYQIGAAALFGVRERRRLGVLRCPQEVQSLATEAGELPQWRRPRMMLPNLLLTIALLFCLVAGALLLGVIPLVSAAT
jgi:CitMHS family citrate-Mg2+:H+ or citrate-Ca2+:H+ symporter